MLVQYFLVKKQSHIHLIGTCILRESRKRLLICGHFKLLIVSWGEQTEQNRVNGVASPGLDLPRTCDGQWDRGFPQCCCRWQEQAPGV